MLKCTINNQQSTINNQFRRKPLTQIRQILALVLMVTMLFSGIANANESLSESPVTINSWIQDIDNNVPILQFSSSGPEFDKIVNDINVENMVTQKDGSVRFQLSYSTPFGRTTFANVIKTDLGNGLHRNSITNIADGKQTIFISEGEGDSLELINVEEIESIRSAGKNLTKPECGPPCVWAVIVAAEALACTSAAMLFSLQCSQVTCRATGVEEYSAGMCGAYSVCKCFPPPPPRITPPGPIGG